MSIQQAVACKYLMMRGKYNFKTLSRLISFALRLQLLAILSFFSYKDFVHLLEKGDEKTTIS